MRNHVQPRIIDKEPHVNKILSDQIRDTSATDTGVSRIKEVISYLNVLRVIFVMILTSFYDDLKYFTVYG